MKILYVDHYEADYGSAMLWDGLCKTLGEDKVIDFPLKMQFHGSSPWPFIVNRPGHSFSETDILDMKFDFLCLASTRKSNTELVLRWKDAGVKLPPIVLVDQDEPTQAPMAHISMFNPICCFKREYVLNRYYPENCYPLPFSSAYPLYEPTEFVEERPIDVCCMMADNHPNRRWISWLIESLGHCGYRIVSSFHRHVDWNEYITTLQKSKIGVSVRGVGFDTVRFLEVVASHCLLLSDESPLVRPYPFLDWKHCVYYHEGNLAWMIEHFLSDAYMRIQIADAGYRHLKQYHTTEVRATYFLEKVSGHL